MVDLVGRDAELQLLLARLRDRRLVTLVGPGGIGKTALAKAAVELTAADFDEGALVIDLTQVDEPSAVPEWIAGRLGHASFRALLDSPGDHPVLLLVDNCEHVLDAAADALDQLLAACLMPTVLATSRSALEVPGEVVVPVGPLPVPPPGANEAPAVDLLVRLAADVGVELPRTAPVVELCRRLDGVPLALELAAARLRSLTVEEVVARLAEGLDVLDRPRRRAAPRHRGLRAAVAWSYDLLAADEQELFERMAVFPGPVTAQAVHEVVGDGGGLATTQDRLDGLVAASLLVAEPIAGTTRYRMLEVLRSFARERLDGRGERRALEARLVDQVVARVLAVLGPAAERWDASAWASLRLGYDEMVAAIRWCLAEDATPDRAQLLAAVLWAVAHDAHTEEIGQLADAVLARWPREGDLWPDVVSTAAACRLMLGSHAEAVALAEDALAVAEVSPYAPATLRRTIAFGRRALGDLVGSLAAYAEAADAADQLGLDALAVDARTARAQVRADAGDLDGALDALAGLRAGQHGAEGAGDGLPGTWVRAVEGTALLARDPAAAEAVLLEALDRSRTQGYSSGEAVALRGLGLAACRQDEPTRAAGRALELLEHLLARGSTAELGLVLDVAVPALAAAGRLAAASGLQGLARTLPVASIVSGSMSSSQLPVGGLPPAPVPSVRDALVALRRELAALAVGEEKAASAPSPGGRIGTFRLVGDIWEVGLDGSAVAVRPSKGMTDLARLLAAPGQEVHCLELAGGGLDQGPAGAGIDGEARRSYEARIRELQHELDDADAAGDRGRAEKASLELDLLVDQLTSALGLGGRARPSGSSAERARSAVTQRVRSTIKRLGSIHPALGRHLEASIRTGAFCSYQPEAPVVWTLT